MFGATYKETNGKQKASEHGRIQSMFGRDLAICFQYLLAIFCSVEVSEGRESKEKSYVQELADEALERLLWGEESKSPTNYDADIT